MVRLRQRRGRLRCPAGKEEALRRGSCRPLWQQQPVAKRRRRERVRSGGGRPAALPGHPRCWRGERRPKTRATGPVYAWHAVPCRGRPSTKWVSCPARPRRCAAPVAWASAVSNAGPTPCGAAVPGHLIRHWLAWWHATMAPTRRPVEVHDGPRSANGVAAARALHDCSQSWDAGVLVEGRIRWRGVPGCLCPPPL